MAYRFYRSEDGQIMVVDEWPDEQSFQSFFDANREKIGAMMQAAGVTSEPQPRFWRKLDSHDEYGWAHNPSLRPVTPCVIQGGLERPAISRKFAQPASAYSRRRT